MRGLTLQNLWDWPVEHQLWENLASGLLAPDLLTADLFRVESTHIEMQETPDALLVRVDVPGLDMTDLDVQVSQQTLTLVGQQQIEYGRGYSYAVGYREFSQTIPLPVPVEDRQVQMTYRPNGLVITLPKRRSRRFWGSNRPQDMAAVSRTTGTLKSAAVAPVQDWDRNQTWMDEVRYQGRRLAQGWRQTRQWLGRQFHKLGNWMLADG